MTGIFGAKHKRLTPGATRTIVFQRENLNYLIVCITQCTLFFFKSFVVSIGHLHLEVM